MDLTLSLRLQFLFSLLVRLLAYGSQKSDYSCFDYNVCFDFNLAFYFFFSNFVVDICRNEKNNDRRCAIMVTRFFPYLS